MPTYSMTDSTLSDRAKPRWLPLYSFYLWFAVLASAVAIVRYGADAGGFGVVGIMLVRLGFFLFAIYSVRHIYDVWVRFFHLLFNACVVILSLVYLTPFGQLLPRLFGDVAFVISVPIYAMVPDETLFATSPLLFMLVGLVFVLISAIWFVCWNRFRRSISTGIAPVHRVRSEPTNESGSAASKTEDVIEHNEPVADIGSDDAAGAEKPKRSIWKKDVTGTALIRELWRRNVFKIGLAYFIAASLFGSVPVFAFLAFGGCDPPDWLWTAISTLLYAGFPVALYFTWVMQPSDRETRQIVLGTFSGLIMSVGLLAVVGGIKLIAAQPSGDVTIYIFFGLVLLAIGVPLTGFGYRNMMKQIRNFKAERSAREDSYLATNYGEESQAAPKGNALTDDHD